MMIMQLSRRSLRRPWPGALLELAERFPLAALRIGSPAQPYMQPARLLHARVWTRASVDGASASTAPVWEARRSLWWRERRPRIQIVTHEESEPQDEVAGRVIMMTFDRRHLGQHAQREIARAIRRAIRAATWTERNDWILQHQQHARPSLGFSWAVTRASATLAVPNAHILQRLGPTQAAKLASRRLRSLTLIYMKARSTPWWLHHADLEGRRFYHRHPGQIVLLHQDLHQLEPPEPPGESGRSDHLDDLGPGDSAKTPKRPASDPARPPRWLRVALLRALLRQLGPGHELALAQRPHRLPPRRLRELERLAGAWAALQPDGR